MREFVAAVVALMLLFAAANLSTTLKAYRQRRKRAQDRQRALGRTVVAELPGPDDLVLFSEDADAFHYGEILIAKPSVVGARLLVNGRAIATAGAGDASDAQPESEAALAEFQAEGIPKDRWDVRIDTSNGPTLVECGSVRERVSQELAAAVFDAVKRQVARATTPSRADRRDG